MMNTLVALQLGAGIGVGSILLWLQCPADFRRWLDVALVGLWSGLVGARLGYLFLHADYFAEFPIEILKVWFGGFVWQVGVLAGWGGAWGFARRQHIDWQAWSDAAALTLPVGMMAGWWACREMGCAYGTDGDGFPMWLTGYLPDTDGDVALRLETQLIGVLTGWLSLIGLSMLTLRNRAVGKRFALSVLGVAVSAFTLEFLQAEPSTVELGLNGFVVLVAFVFSR